MANRAAASASDAKIVIYSRVDPATVAALDKLCEAMRPKPTRAQLIDVALDEYVERRRKGNANRPAKGGG
jgi:predicted transcriptional regulator